MYIVGKTLLGTLSSIAGIILPPPQNQYEWKIEIYKNDGGLKKSFIVGQADNPITKIDFELNKKLCGAGSIDFAYLDFPLDMADYILVYWFGKLKYRGKIENVTDPKGGSVKLTSYVERLNNIITFNIYTDKTIEYMLNDIIVNGQPNEPKIKWNDYTVEIDDVDTYTIDFSSGKSLKQAIDEIVGLLDDTEWGVDENNFFWVYQANTIVDRVLYNNYYPVYSEIEVDKDYSKVEATRYEVFRKITSTNETAYVSQVGGVGDGISIETEIGEQRIKKYILSEVVSSDAEAESIALANLKAQAITPISVNVKNVNLDYWFPEINERVTVQDKTEYILKTIVNCNTTTLDDTTFSQTGRWYGNVTASSTYSITGGLSIKKTWSGYNDSFYYDFGEIIRFFNPTKIGFMVLSDYPMYDLMLTIGTQNTGWSSGSWSEGDWSETSETYVQGLIDYTFSNETVGVWTYKDFKLTTSDIRFIKFTNPNLTNNKSIYIDRIQLFLPSREVITANVCKANITIKREGYNCNVQLNDYDKFANDEDFANQKRIAKLEQIADNS